MATQDHRYSGQSVVEKRNNILYEIDTAKRQTFLWMWIVRTFGMVTFYIGLSWDIFYCGDAYLFTDSEGFIEGWGYDRYAKNSNPRLFDEYSVSQQCEMSWPGALIELRVLNILLITKATFS